MLDPRHLMYATMGIPVLVVLVVLFGGSDMSERHHLHHDTYAVSLVVSRTLVLVIVFMGVLGALTGWLCNLGVFSTDPAVPLAFFASFEMTILLVLAVVMRHRVMAYDDVMMVRPSFGREKTIYYDHITRMEWVSSRLGPHVRDLRVFTDEGKRVRISYLLDIEQILLRIDRFDVLVG